MRKRLPFVLALTSAALAFSGSARAQEAPPPPPEPPPEPVLDTGALALPPAATMLPAPPRLRLPPAPVRALAGSAAVRPGKVPSATLFTLIVPSMVALPVQRSVTPLGTVNVTPAATVMVVN